MSSRFSSNSEAEALDLLENLEEMFPCPEQMTIIDIVTTSLVSK